MLSPDGSSKKHTLYDSSGMASGDVSALTSDSEDNVWAGSDAGLWVLEPNESHWKKILWEGIYALAADQQGRLWAATEGDISRLSAGEWTHFGTGYTTLYNTNTKGLAVDPQGRVWAADLFYAGILSTDGNWESSNLRFDVISYLAIDEEGDLWVRASSGLSVCIEKKCTEYSNITTALSPSGSAMAFDNDNRLWFPYATGLRVLDVERLLPAPILNGILVIRRVVNFTLLLIAYLFIVQLSDARKEKVMPDQLKIRDIMKIVWPTWILGGIVGLALIIFSNVFSNLEFSLSFVLVGILGGLLTWVRMISLMARSHISKSDVVISTFVGAIITGVSAAVFVFLFIIVGVTTGFLAQ